MRMPIINNNKHLIFLFALKWIFVSSFIWIGNWVVFAGETGSIRSESTTYDLYNFEFMDLAVNLFNTP